MLAATAMHSPCTGCHEKLMKAMDYCVVAIVARLPCTTVKHDFAPLPQGWRSQLGTASIPSHLECCGFLGHGRCVIARFVER